MNYRLLCFLLLMISNLVLLAQSERFEMNARNWNIDEETMSFEDFSGQKVLLIKGAGEAILQDFNFSVGTIEFDFYATELRFCGIYFRRDRGANKSADFFSDHLYLRTFKMDDPFAPGSMQYAPITRGTNLWDLLHQYESSALIKSDSWNKIKLVISRKQMKCYLNGDLVLWIPELMGKNSEGMISFEGPGRYANLNVTANAIEDLPNLPSADVTIHDVRYLNDWEYTGESVLLNSSSIAGLDLPDSTSLWSPIEASRFGLINLTEELSSLFIDGERRMIWLRTTINSEIDQLKDMNLGFSDDIALYVNGELVHVDRNTFGRPIAKNPNGRIHLDNLTISIPLLIGKNEILIAVANNFFGWGLVARLHSMSGVNGKMVHE